VSGKFLEPVSAGLGLVNDHSAVALGFISDLVGV